MDRKRIRVFVTDGFWRKSLAAVRALGRMGVRVTAGESTYLAPALFSRYCHRRVRTPSPVLEPTRFVSFLETYLAEHPHDVLLPMEEETLLLLARNRERFQGSVRLPIADYGCLLFVRDKLNVLRRAESLGIAIPKTYELADLEDGISLSKDLPYPVVVKPRVGSGSAGVAYAANSDELLVALKRSFDSGRVPFIQERLPREGEGIGVSLLMGEKGAVRASFVHRRLREYPVQGGPSTLRESFVHDPAKDDALRLLRSFGFTGVAMVEFKMDTRDGKAKLLEINPRFWGSLALAVDSGVNFPWLLTLMAMNHEFSAVQTYRLGHRCRWLLPGDILHFLENSERWLMEPGFFRFKEPHLTYDIIDMQDPFPIIGTFLSLLPFYCGEHFAHVRGRRTKPRSTVIGQLGNRS